MNHLALEASTGQTHANLNAEHAIYLNAAEQACQRIAPLWPLDQSIAVNPWWPLREKPMAEVAGMLAVLGKVHCYMPKAYYQEQWQAKKLNATHLRVACESLGREVTETALVTYLEESALESHWMNISDLLDAAFASSKKMAWHDEIIFQLSQFCGGFFQHPDSLANEALSGDSLYRAWLKTVRQDKGIEILMGQRGLNAQFKQLPAHPEALIATAAAELLPVGTPEEVFADYCHALLLDINGWASWLAYQDWQNALDQKEDPQVLAILAIRLAWDLVLWRHTRAQDEASSSAQREFSFRHLQQQFNAQLKQLPLWLAQYRSDLSYLEIWQRAQEFAYQMPLNEQLAKAVSKNAAELKADAAPELQAVFCIDVRSEPMRRALEAQSPNIQTFGFAGFFGLPIDYSPQGTDYVRPQLPGLLKPAIRAVQSGAQPVKLKSKALKIRNKFSVQQSIEGASAAYGLIEAQGLFKAFELLKKSLLASQPHHAINQLSAEGEWVLSRAGEALDTESLADLAAGILGALGLTENFAARVLLLGHGSCSSNNPFSASLDCGACGGQTGEVNARILAQLLNAQEIRACLKQKGIDIPAQTQFVAGLHNTTTDEIHCFGLDASQQQSPWFNWLAAATELAQANRLDAFETKPAKQTPDKQSLKAFYQARTKDWAQVRPEWGLANNASFIVAPRAVTKGLNLQGRSFLHEYAWQKDKDFSVLELIMTAPMVVTNWINLQYYASVTDNLKYGSGNKLLHNVVGGHIGVFEGNSGDLRGGLSIQSLHDGDNWRHQALRLSVYIDAPRDAIEAIILKHPNIANLIENNWLFLFQIDSVSGISQYKGHQWSCVYAHGGAA